MLARRNDADKDRRAAAREEANRAAALAERLNEERHERQRETLLELQDELQKLARATGRILHQDLMTVRQQGGVFLLPDATMSEDSLAATVAVLKLKERVLVDELRALIWRIRRLLRRDESGHQCRPPGAQGRLSGRSAWR